MTTIVVTAAVDRARRLLSGHAAAARRAPRGILGIPRRQVRGRRIARRVPGARAARGARRRRAHRRRDPHDHARLSRSARRAALSSLRAASASRGRSWVRRCGGCRARSWPMLEFPPADAELIELLAALTRLRRQAAARSGALPARTAAPDDGVRRRRRPPTWPRLEEIAMHVAERDRPLQRRRHRAARHRADLAIADANRASRRRRAARRRAPGRRACAPRDRARGAARG